MFCFKEFRFDIGSLFTSVHYDSTDSIEVMDPDKMFPFFRIVLNLFSTGFFGEIL